ncbi:MAG: glycosyltransferase [Algibacter sp.]
MNVKRILIISPFFFPEPISTGKFNTDIAKALRDEGHEITVLCSHPLYPKWVPEKNNEQISGIKIIRGGGGVRYPKKTIIRRVVLELWFSYYILKNIFKYRKSIDIVIPIFPPSFAFYIILPFINKKTETVGMVHDLQEVYSKGRKGIINKVVRFFINKIEGATFRGCDKLIFLSEEMKNIAQYFYKLDTTKAFVQYPFVTIEKDNVTDDLEDILPLDKTHIVYSGALGEKQNPKGLYDFFQYASQNTTNTYFHFFSQGLIFEELKSINKNTFIRFHDLVPRKNIEELYIRSSIQIIPQQSGTSKGSLPSKLPNLLASGCKILFITDKGSEIHELFKKHNLEKVVTSWANEELMNGVFGLLEKNNEIDNNQIRVAEEFFSINSMVKKIV